MTTVGDHSKQANAACRRRSLLALHILLWHNDNYRVCSLVEFHARNYSHRRAVDIVVHADFFMPKGCDAGTGGRSTLVGDLALDRVVCKVAIFVPVGARKIFTDALRRSTDARDVPNGALLFGYIAAPRGFGFHSRARDQDDCRECRCKEVSHGANHRYRIEVLDCNVILPRGSDGWRKAEISRPDKPLFALNQSSVRLTQSGPEADKHARLSRPDLRVRTGTYATVHQGTTLPR